MDRRGCLRRIGVLAGGSVAIAGALAGCLGGGDRREGFGDWFDDVENYAGVVDRTGRSRVTVAVGATDPPGGPFVFAPAAVAVSPGTTVVWEWTGAGGEHNVVEERGTYSSPFSSREGFTFEHTFEAPRFSRYVCEPHRSLGMKGGVEVRE